MNKRKRMFFANRLHREIMYVVFISAVVPALIVGLSVYALIFAIASRYIKSPNEVSSIITPALKFINPVILAALPVSVILIWWWALVISHRIVGPVDRVIREIDEVLSGKKKDHIRLRAMDAMSGLVDRINRLLDKIPK